MSHFLTLYRYLDALKSTNQFYRVVRLSEKDWNQIMQLLVKEATERQSNHLLRAALIGIQKRFNPKNVSEVRDNASYQERIDNALFKEISVFTDYIPDKRKCVFFTVFYVLARDTLWSPTPAVYLTVIDSFMHLNEVESGVFTNRLLAEFKDSYAELKKLVVRLSEEAAARASVVRQRIVAVDFDIEIDSKASEVLEKTHEAESELSAATIAIKKDEVGGSIAGVPQVSAFSGAVRSLIAGEPSAFRSDVGARAVAVSDRLLSSEKLDSDAAVREKHEAVKVEVLPTATKKMDATDSRAVTSRGVVFFGVVRRPATKDFDAVRFESGTPS